MRFSNLSARGSYADFSIQNVDLSLVNALRRAIMAEVPTAAFCFNPNTDDNTVDIKANTSVLHNEFLGHRISLVPVHLDENEMLDVFEGKSDYEFALSVRNTGTSPIDVTSSNFTATLNGEPLPADTIARLFPADVVTRDHILIVRLKPGSGDDSHDAEELEVKCKLRMGCGKDHACWTPTSLCTFGNVIDDGKARAALEEELAKAKAMHATDEELARVAHDFQAMGRQRCFRVDEHGDPAEFVFKLRSECGLRPTYIVFKGLQVLSQRSRALAEAIASAQPLDPATPAPVTMEAYEAVPGMHEFRIEREDHTLGNLVQSGLFNRFIRGHDLESTGLEYVGYHQQHPLEHRITLRVKVGPSVSDVRGFISTCVGAVSSEIDQVTAEWVEFSGLAAAGIREVDAFMQKRVQSIGELPVITPVQAVAPAAKAKPKRAPAKRKKKGEDDDGMGES